MSHAQNFDGLLRIICINGGDITKVEAEEMPRILEDAKNDAAMSGIKCRYKLEEMTYLDFLLEFDSDYARAHQYREHCHRKPNKDGKSMQDIFDEIDSDGNGSLTMEEFESAGKKLCKAMGFSLTDDLLADAFAELDTDKSSRVDITEFEVWWKTWLTPPG